MDDVKSMILMFGFFIRNLFLDKNRIELFSKVYVFFLLSFFFRIILMIMFIFVGIIVLLVNVSIICYFSLRKNVIFILRVCFF